MAEGKRLSLFVALVLFEVAAALPKLKDATPSWGDVYSVQGTLKLPYAEIVEPFSGYYDATNMRSRVDYYGGMVMTMQRADQGQFGNSYKVAPVSNYKVQNQVMCFKVAGASDMPVTIQNILPDLSGFQKVNTGVMINGQPCDEWQNVTIVGHKKNVYTMWVTASGAQPVRYEMMGFDSLLGSHFDKYVLDYFQFMQSPIPEAMFEPPANLTCGDFPGPGSSVHRVLNNPIMEYVNRHDNHITEMFQDFKKKHQPKYANEKEHAQREHNFRQNVRFIHSKNRQGLTYQLDVNHLTDRSNSELKMMNGYRHTPGDHGAKLFDKASVDPKAVPDTLDWRILGAVTPVKDQGVCGSCWSFGTVGTIEGAYFVKYGNLVRFSQQELIDCSWGEGNNGCDGGEDFRSYMYIMKTGGLTTEEQYGQYLAQDGNCRSNTVKPVVKIQSYANITSKDQEALRFAIAKKGPISVGIDASHKSLSFYSNGVYYEPKCGSEADQLDHAVLAVGYGTLNGQAYWLIKNSWSTYWGNDGYVLMSQKDNNCGVATAATFVNLE